MLHCNYNNEPEQTQTQNKHKFCPLPLQSQSNPNIMQIPKKPINNAQNILEVKNFAGCSKLHQLDNGMSRMLCMIFKR